MGTLDQQIPRSLDKTVAMTLAGLTMNGDITLAGDIIPDADDTRSLGASGKDFLKIWNNDADAFAVAPTPASHTVDKHTDRTRKVWLPAQTDLTDNANFFGTQEMPDGSTTVLRVTWIVPDDFVSIVSAKAVVVADAGSGNVRMEYMLDFGTDDETYWTNQASTGEDVEAVVEDKIEFLRDFSSIFSGIASGDVLGIAVRREGGDATDTLNSILDFVGVLITYTGSQ